MWTCPEIFDVIVVGAGHAGCEAAHAAARMGCRTLLLTMNLDTIAKMSCNPAVGGTAKGHIVREIDALGGIMGKVTDQTAIQYRMLNASKGPAVWSPRAQADKIAYQSVMKKRLEATPHLFIKQGTTENLIVENNKVVGVATQEGIAYHGSTVILSSGTFMRGMIHIGPTTFSGGRAGDKPSVGLSPSLEKLGFKLGRLKTGTPPRVNRRSIDFSQMEVQYGDQGVRFSYDPPETEGLPQIPCYITYTTEETKKVIQANLHLSPMYSGKIQSVGPRYCPSIEDKIVRFADKERHQIFIEPEGLQTDEMYINGISTSLPFDVQIKMLHTIPGMQHAEIMRPAYAIEYDYITSGQLHLSLETKLIEGLFLCGQINGTTGYEEAAGQGIIAGINAACKALGKPSFYLKRSEAYIGVMIDELNTKELEEPYRMFTSRAEHRLLLRQDNADLRLRAYGYQIGLIEEAQYQRLIQKMAAIKNQIEILTKKHVKAASFIIPTQDSGKRSEAGSICTPQPIAEGAMSKAEDLSGKAAADRNPVGIIKEAVKAGGKSCSLAQLLCRPTTTYKELIRDYPEFAQDHGTEINLQIELQLKYAGYIERQTLEAAKLDHLDHITIPLHFNFNAIKGVSNEAREKLSRSRPANLGIASRLSGITPGDITVLMVALRNRN